MINYIDSVHFQNLPIYGVRIHPTTGFPSNPSNGQIVYDTSSNRYFFYKGNASGWYLLGSGSFLQEWNAISGGNSRQSNQTFIMGSGGAIRYSGGGIVDANRFNGRQTLALSDGGTNSTSAFANAIVFTNVSADTYLTDAYLRAQYAPTQYSISIGDTAGGPFRGAVTIGNEGLAPALYIAPKSLVSPTGANYFEWNGNNFFITDQYCIARARVLTDQDLLSSMTGILPLNLGGTNQNQPYQSGSIIITDGNQYLGIRPSGAGQAGLLQVGENLSNGSGYKWLVGNYGYPAEVAFWDGSEWTSVDSTQYFVYNSPQGSNYNYIIPTSGNHALYLQLGSAQQDYEGFIVKSPTGANRFSINGSGQAVFYEGAFRLFGTSGTMVDFRNPTSGQVLGFNGTKWVPANVSGGVGNAVVKSPSGGSNFIKSVTNDPGLIIMGHAGGNANTFEVRNSGNIQYFFIRSNGNAQFAGSITSDGNVSAGNALMSSQAVGNAFYSATNFQFNDVFSAWANVRQSDLITTVPHVVRSLRVNPTTTTSGAMSMITSEGIGSFTSGVVIGSGYQTLQNTSGQLQIIGQSGYSALLIQSTNTTNRDIVRISYADNRPIFRIGSSREVYIGDRTQADSQTMLSVSGSIASNINIYAGVGFSFISSDLGMFARIALSDVGNIYTFQNNAGNSYRGLFAGMLRIANAPIGNVGTYDQIVGGISRQGVVAGASGLLIGSSGYTTTPTTLRGMTDIWGASGRVSLYVSGPTGVTSGDILTLSNPNVGTMFSVNHSGVVSYAYSSGRIQIARGFIAGTGILSNGEANIANPFVTNNSHIQITVRQLQAGSLANVGIPVVYRQIANSGFMIRSTNAADTSSFCWELKELI